MTRLMAASATVDHRHALVQTYDPPATTIVVLNTKPILTPSSTVAKVHSAIVRAADYVLTLSPPRVVCR